MTQCPGRCFSERKMIHHQVPLIHISSIQGKFSAYHHVAKETALVQKTEEGSGAGSLSPVALGLQSRFAVRLSCALQDAQQHPGLYPFDAGAPAPRVPPKRLPPCPMSSGGHKHLQRGATTLGLGNCMKIFPFVYLCACLLGKAFVVRVCLVLWEMPRNAGHAPSSITVTANPGAAPLVA